MRITVEPTQSLEKKEVGNPEEDYPKVIIEYQYDHMDIYAWVILFQTLLRAMGFHESMVNRLRIEE